MEVQVKDESGVVLWARGPAGGLTSQSYGADGTLEQVAQALGHALEQCRGELSISMDSDGVFDIGRAPT
jgi:hypothetical protein